MNSKIYLLTFFMLIVLMFITQTMIDCDDSNNNNVNQTPPNEITNPTTLNSSVTLSTITTSTTTITSSTPSDSCPGYSTFTIPPTHYAIDGKAVQIQGTSQIPINNIEINFYGTGGTNVLLQTVLTTATGSFFIEFTDGNPLIYSNYIVARDIDGTLNGGLYLDYTFSNTFTTTIEKNCPWWNYKKTQTNITLSMTTL